MKTLGVIALLAIGTSVSLLAIPVPEIDPASGGSALALLAAAAVMIRGRRKK
jgi:hypothetical protein